MDFGESLSAADTAPAVVRDRETAETAQQIVTDLEEAARLLSDAIRRAIARM